MRKKIKKYLYHIRPQAKSQPCFKQCDRVRLSVRHQCLSLSRSPTVSPVLSLSPFRASCKRMPVTFPPWISCLCEPSIRCHGEKLKTKGKASRLALCLFSQLVLSYLNDFNLYFLWFASPSLRVHRQLCNFFKKKMSIRYIAKKEKIDPGFKKKLKILYFFGSGK